VLAHRFGKDVLLARAAQIDAGCNAKVLAGMFATSTGSRTTRSPCPTARPQPNCERSTQPGDQNWQLKPEQLTAPLTRLLMAR